MTTILLVILAMITVGAAGFALVPSALGGSRADKRRKALQGDMRVNRLEASVEEAIKELKRARLIGRPAEDISP